MDLFPLLTLPPRALHKLLNRFQFGELFQLSQGSRIGFDIVKTFASSFDETPFEISVTTSTQVTVSVSVSLSMKNEIPTPHSIEDFFKFAYYCKTLFNANLDEVEMTIDDDSLKVILMSKWLLKSQFLSIGEGRVTHEEMVQLLEYFDGVKNLELDCSPGQYFSYDQIISINRFKVNGSIWIKRHNLLKIDCEYVNISDCHLENEDLNAFLSHWLQSGDKKLKFMTIRGKFCFSEEEKKNTYKFVQEEVLKGLSTLPGAPKRRSAIRVLRHININIPFEARMDLRRESDDGVLATVVVRARL